MKEKDDEVINDELVETIRDLTRVLIIENGEFESQSELVRKLYDFSVSPARIAKLLGMKSKDVTSIISKRKKSKKQSSITSKSLIQK